MKANYIPNEDRVVVSVPKKVETTTDSGIIVPVEASEDEKLVEVIVEATGDGQKARGELINMYLVPGQRVVIGINTGVPYEMDGKDFRMIRQEDVQFLISEK